MKKIPSLGAGVLGSLYAARLKQSGQDVTIPARGTRLKDIKEYGIILEHVLTGKREVVAVPVVEHLLKTDRYNLIVVLVRKNQLVSALLILAAHKGTPDIVFMVSNPSGWVDAVKAVGPERLILGFAGAGGMRIGHVVRYVVVSRLLQPTAFDELDGSKSARLKEIMQIFSRAGSSTASTPKMDAWQKTHVAWISPVENAMYKVDRNRLASHAAAADGSFTHMDRLVVFVCADISNIYCLAIQQHRKKRVCSCAVSRYGEHGLHVVSSLWVTL